MKFKDILKNNRETINLYNSLIQTSKGTLRENQIGSYRYEIKKLLIENYEIYEKINTLKSKKRVPKAIKSKPKDQIWLNHLPWILKFVDRDNITVLQLEKEEQFCIDYLIKNENG